MKLGENIVNIFVSFSKAQSDIKTLSVIMIIIVQKESEFALPHS